MQMRYAPGQDRLQLRMNTEDGTEFSFWLTRRCVKVLWPMLMEALDSGTQVASQADPVKREAVKAFQHQHAVENTDYERAYEEKEDRRKPLGDAPLLVQRVDVRRLDADRVSLGFRPGRGQGVDIGMQEQLLHGFCNLLSQAVSKSGWDLELRVAKPSHPRSEDQAVN